MSNKPSQEPGKQIKVHETVLQDKELSHLNCQNVALRNTYLNGWFFIKIDNDRVFGNMQGKCYVKIIDIEDTKMEILLTV